MPSESNNDTAEISISFKSKLEARPAATEVYSDGCWWLCCSPHGVWSQLYRGPESVSRNMKPWGWKSVCKFMLCCAFWRRRRPLSFRRTVFLEKHQPAGLGSGVWVWVIMLCDLRQILRSRQHARLENELWYCDDRREGVRDPVALWRKAQSDKLCRLTCKSLKSWLA